MYLFGDASLLHSEVACRCWVRQRGRSYEAVVCIPAWGVCERGECMSDECCPKCGGKMIDGTAGVSALRIWYRPDKWSMRHASFKLTASHADVVRANACEACGYVDLYVDPDYLKKFTS